MKTTTINNIVITWILIRTDNDRETLKHKQSGTKIPVPGSFSGGVVNNFSKDTAGILTWALFCKTKLHDSNHMLHL